MYKKLKNKLKASIHEAKLQYLHSLLEKSKSDPHIFHDLWCGVNDIIGRRTSPPSAANADLSPDLLNNFFSTVAISDRHQPATCSTPPSCTKPHFILHQSLLRLHKHLNIRKSTGPDGLSSFFLKEVAVEIAEPLTKLYNISLQSGCIPLEWKHCNVTSVHKSGPQQDPSNFRPILVVPVIAKTMEKIFANQLNCFLPLSGCISTREIY